MATKNQLQTLPNGILLAGGGLAVLLVKGLLLNPVSRFILAGVAGVWGIYQLITNKNKTPGITAIASSGILIIFGTFVSGLATVAGVGLIIAGAVSLISGLFRKQT